MPRQGQWTTTEEERVATPKEECRRQVEDERATAKGVHCCRVKDKEQPPKRNVPSHMERNADTGLRTSVSFPPKRNVITP